MTNTTKIKKRLLFFDIDGTLIAENHQIPDSVYPAMRKAQENGCLLFINSGRTLCNLDPRLKEIPLDGMVMGCGARVICHGETLQAVEFSAEDSLRIRDVCLRHQVPTVYECDTGMYFDPEGPTWPEIEQFITFSDRAGLTRYISDQDPEFRAVKLFSFTDEETLHRMLDDLRERGYAFDPIDRGGGGWEIVPEGCSKATGIEILRQALGIPLEDCYAFGDSTNDLPMLEHVPNSVAMGNAADEVKKVCRYVTSRPEEDGIAKAIMALGLTTS